MSEPRIDPMIAEQTSKNLGLAARFLAEALEDERVVAALPADRPLVFVTADDSGLSRRNFELAVRELFKGRSPVLYRIGGPQPGAETWKAADRRHLTMEDIRFPDVPMRAADVRIVYDQSRDTLMVDYFGGRRAPFTLPVGPHIILRIDPDTHEVVGYMVASYLQVEAYRSPVLARALRKAQFRDLTDDELGDIGIVREGDTPFDDDEAAAVATEFVRWIASGPRRRDRNTA